MRIGGRSDPLEPSRAGHPAVATGYNNRVRTPEQETARRPRVVDVQVQEEFRPLVPEPWLRGVVGRALEVLDEGGASLLIADDDVVAELNGVHRGVREATDVLSFSFEHWGAYYGDGEAPFERADDFVLPPGVSAGMGEVVVSYPQARRQAREAGRSMERELEALIVHGLAHLAGHDHEEEGEAAAMREVEGAILRELRLSGGSQ